MALRDFATAAGWFIGKSSTPLVLRKDVLLLEARSELDGYLRVLRSGATVALGSAKLAQNDQLFVNFGFAAMILTLKGGKLSFNVLGTGTEPGPSPEGGGSSGGPPPDGTPPP